MRRFTPFIFLLCTHLAAFQALPERMQVHYGDPDAPVCLVEYLDIECVACTNFFNYDSEELHTRYIDKGKAKLAIHLTPNTHLAVQLLLCIHDLQPEGRKVQQELLAYVMKSVTRRSDEAIRDEMRETMQKHGKDASFITDQPQDVMTHPQTTILVEFMKQGDAIPPTPSMDIDGRRLPGRPDMTEISRAIRARLAGS